MSSGEIQTKRLRLVPNTPEDVREQIERMDADQRAQLSPVWVSRARAATTIDPWTLGFTLRDRATGSIVGSCGFKGPPDADGMVEIAYGVAPEHQNKGYATEAARALLTFAFGESQVKVVCAHTIAEANASTRVLAKCGFHPVGQVVDPEDGLVWRWEKQTLQIVSYDPRWVEQFAAERDRIVRVLGPLARRIDHNGSTSVPGLDAKPIIDIQISVERLDPISAYGVPLTGLGYKHVPHPDDAVCPFFHRPHAWPHSHHVHVVEAGGGEERRTLAFRDYLRDHGDVAREYGVLKRQLAASYDGASASDREAYANAKTEFVERIVRLALEQGYPRKGFC